MATFSAMEQVLANYRHMLAVLNAEREREKLLEIIEGKPLR